jgi:uncharacterized membrane protein YdjX (TVP38/TMEM64 family)
MPHFFDLLLTWCRENPAWLFFAIAILPGFAFPSSPLLVLAGIVWGCNLSACVLVISAVLLNITWTHWLSAGPCRKIISRILGERWQRWQSMPRANLWKLTLMLRITPGVPLFIQNYTLGLLGVPLLHSLAIAFPISWIYVGGFVLTGGAIFKGQIGLVIAGISLLAAASIGINLARKRLFKDEVKEMGD